MLPVVSDKLTNSTQYGMNMSTCSFSSFTGTGSSGEQLTPYVFIIERISSTVVNSNVVKVCTPTPRESVGEAFFLGNESRIFLIFSWKYCKKLLASIVSDSAVGRVLTFSESVHKAWGRHRGYASHLPYGFSARLPPPLSIFASLIFYIFPMICTKKDVFSLL